MRKVVGLRGLHGDVGIKRLSDLDYFLQLLHVQTDMLGEVGADLVLIGVVSTSIGSFSTVARRAYNAPSGGRYLYERTPCDRATNMVPSFIYERNVTSGCR